MTIEEVQVVSDNNDFEINSVLEEHISTKNHEELMKALSVSVEESGKGNFHQGIHTPSAKAPSHWYRRKLTGWLHHHLVPEHFRLAVEKKFGVFIVLRDTNEYHYEEMPIYTRIGMHLLFVGHHYHEKFVDSSMMHRLFLHESLKQGTYFTDPKSVSQIPSFINHYSIDMTDYVQQDISAYANFNEFFIRAIRPEVRPIADPNNLDVLVSAADCRLNVFHHITEATEYWIKGKKFTLANLFQNEDLAKSLDGGSLAIFRLAPQDYHRFHSPTRGTVQSISNIEGTYFTVNPCTVREELDVFTENHRQIIQMKDYKDRPFAVVAVGALLVGSIQLTNAKNEGATLDKGEEMGYFQYGGSTVICVFGKDTVHWDQDLTKNSTLSFETYVRMGERIGTFI
ncbi:phosphatidylserine decarboxylase-domain-containing protein [Halteromyces radiatus]|uniref:phosphatidylserine decarboxylase-domain-containing protein n=1 Tax=Halteromyces radiatus TaxID=101107 RepID=UPI00221EF615|nr:phosphatidylserine decarboxylase-domain-containing protein [Halteromyces radiatus]KAI8076745.1 phosphatidylserine decarboxylase-domain-containing protein [Halteromyces radiatus]